MGKIHKGETPARLDKVRRRFEDWREGQPCSEAAS